MSTSNALRLAVMLSALILTGCAAGDVSGVSDTPEEAAAGIVSAAVPAGSPLPGLGDAELARFGLGQTAFASIETVADGLGPVFNDTSCANCHSVPAVGGGSDRVETRFGRLDASGVFDPLASLGGSLIQVNAITGVPGCNLVGEVVPEIATIRAGRRTTPLFGLGLVDAVPDATYEILALIEAQLEDGIAGRPAHVHNLVTGATSVGKFGWKAQVPSLLVFSGDAYLNEMGITNPIFGAESCPQGDCGILSVCDTVADPEDNGTDVGRFADFMTFLAPPPRKPLNLQSSIGAIRFVAFNCVGCHTPALITGPNAVAALDHVVFEPFSDFLLHDMGSLGDGIGQGDASGREMRTAPLWGVSTQPILLHDGRARTIAEAILAHDGQGRAARDRFAGASQAAQRQLIAFLNTL